MNTTSYLALLLLDTTGVWYCCTSSTALMQLRTFFQNLFCLQTTFAFAFYISTSISPTCQIPVDSAFFNHRQNFGKSKKSKTKRWEVQERGSALQNTTKEDQEEKTRKMAATKGSGVDAGIAATAALSGRMFKKKNLNRALKVFSSGYQQGGDVEQTSQLGTSVSLPHRMWRMWLVQFNVIAKRLGEILSQGLRKAQELKQRATFCVTIRDTKPNKTFFFFEC